MPRQFAESRRSTGGQRLCHTPPLGAMAAEIEFPGRAPVRGEGGTTEFNDQSSRLIVARQGSEYKT
jgi:hypothetical protein